MNSISITKVVLLTGLLALARKFIILDLQETTFQELLGLAAVTLALGITYRFDRCSAGARSVRARCAALSGPL